MFPVRQMPPVRKFYFVEPKSSSPNVYSGIHIPRTGAVLLATILREAGYETRVFCEDIAPIDEEELFTADMIGISALTNTARPAYALAEKCRARGIPTVMGGTHASFLADEALGHVDFVVKGEGEGPVLEFLDAMNSGGAFWSIPNLSYWSGGRRGEGIKIHNANRAFVQDLDTLPIPDFSLVHEWGPGCVASIMTSRGCPYDCTFCSVTAMLGRGYRYTSEDRVLEELRRYRDWDYVFFCDDNFVVDRGRTKRILRRKIEEGLDMKWSAQMRTEITDDLELLRLMRESNCFNVYVGFESFNPKTLKLYNKRMDVDRIRESVERFHEYGIKIHGMFVLGSDADDTLAVRDTVRHAKRLDIDTVQFMILTPIPGTVLTRELYEAGRIRTDNWDLFDGHYVTYQPQMLTPYELQSETVRAYRKFYSLPRILGRALRGDKWVTLLRWHARQYLRTWRRRNKGYVKNLREEAFAEVRRLVASGRRRRVRCVAVAEDLFPREQFRFVQTFFRRLGVQVVSLRGEAEAGMDKWIERANEAIEQMKPKIDVLVLPSMGPWRPALADAPLLDIPAEITQAARFHFPVDESGMPSYPALVRVGLVFTKSWRKIGRAFRDAMREAEGEGR